MPGVIEQELGMLRRRARNRVPSTYPEGAAAQWRL